MEINKWIKRKYPTHYNKLKEEFKDYDLELLKTNKYKIGLLTKDVGKNKKGDLCLWKRSKEQGEDWNGLYSYNTGWTGSFEINYRFSKDSEMYYNQSYCLLCEEILPYCSFILKSREKELKTEEKSA